jgi:starch-binding outer membrane protein SusE/F
MKRVSVFKICAVFISVVMLSVACTKDIEDVRLDPAMSTSQFSDVKSNAVTVVGFVIASGKEITERGVCYSITPNPTIESLKKVYEGDVTSATFTVTLTGLNYATKYFIRAYAKVATGIIYGEQIEVTTLPVLPTVTTAQVTDIAGTTAKGGGEVTSTGGAEVTARGLVYGVTANPTIAGSNTTEGEGAGAFVSNLTGLKGLTKYYVRAYATNSVGTAYGEEREFTTLVATRQWYVPGNYVEASYPGTTMKDWNPANSPILKSVEANPDNLEGYIYMKNNAMFKITANPAWVDGFNYGAGDAGKLDPSGGDIALPAGYYKINVNAATLSYAAVATVWGVIGDATPGGWDNSTNLDYDVASQTWRGGVTMAAKEFKFRANNSWDINYGSSSKDEKLNPGGDNIPVAVAGDYYVILDFSKPFEYTYSANRWGVIGSATPGGWDSDTDMTWDAATKSMKVTLDLKAGDIKFRANDDWAINLGGTPANLTQGGDNIAVAQAGNYTINLYLTATGGTYTIVKNSK